MAHLADKLLARPQFGERMAIGWLDVVRFADTIGYHSDNPRNIWPYRDYVIRSFNQNKAFDVFTREQLAGDLLPDAGQEQKVGSAYNRLLLTTEEGGAQPKDYESRMLTDRVRSVGTVWLGQTIGCSQCHDHKFDPITMRDFYSLGAFFSDIDEPILGRREDGMPVPSEAQTAELTARKEKLKQLEAEFESPRENLAAAYKSWLEAQTRLLQMNSRWTSLQPVTAESKGGAKLEFKKDLSILAKGPKPEQDTYVVVLTNLPAAVQAVRLEVLPDDSLPSKGPGRAGNGNFVLNRVNATLQKADGKTDSITFSSAQASFEQSQYAENNADKKFSAASVLEADPKPGLSGWAVLPEVGKPQQIIFLAAQSLAAEPGDSLRLEIVQNHGLGSHTIGRFRVSVTGDDEAAHLVLGKVPAKELADLLSIPADKRNEGQNARLWSEFKNVAPELSELRSRLAMSRKSVSDFEAGIPRCLVSSVAKNHRTVRILPRGNFLNENGEIVGAALPGYLKASWRRQETTKPTRLDLANWLVSEENPLTARVTINRLWKQFFGAGLTKPLDDFGAQGEAPRNPELLDWLACEFMQSGWDVKHMVRVLVNTATYRQSSVLSAEARAIDPENREFSAQGRWRMDAELIRDNALAVAGLLVPTIGGPSVKPYQPEGYWENLNFPQRTWEQSNGADQHRRGLYTWWQRSFLHPSMIAFDAPSREECVAERNRSNIPQQALVLLNDPTYVEAARAFAARILEHGGKEVSERLDWAWRQVLDRAPRKDEADTATALLQGNVEEYRKDPQAADSLLKVGLVAVPEKLDHSELAAWTSVARVVLNLHETVTRN